MIKPDEWEPAVRIMNRIQKLPRGVALLTFAGLTALAAGTAMGDVIYRKDPNKTLVSKNSMIGLFVPTIDIRQWTPGMPDFRYSMRVLFEGTGASISAIVQGNTLTDWGSTIPSPCLAVDGDLDIEGWTLGPVGTTTWRPPQELNPDTLKPASLTQSGSFGDFDLDAFAVGDCAYLGFATFDATRFGYVQIERLDSTDASLWGLIGLAYDLSGAPVEVVDLRTVPVPATVVIVGAAVAMIGRRRRVACVV